MPKVPEENPQFSMNVPGVNAPQTREFGKIGEATEQLGSTVGAESASVGEQITQLDAISQSSNQFYQDKLAANDKMNQLKVSSPDGYMHTDLDDTTGKQKGEIIKNPDGSQRTIVDEFHDWASDQYQKSQDAMPNGVAMQMYRQRALPFLSDSTAMLQNDAMNLRVEADKAQSAARLQDMGTQYLRNPGVYTKTPDGRVSQDISSFYVDSNNFDVDTAKKIGLSYNATTASEISRVGKQKLAYDRINADYVQLYQDKKDGTLDVQRIRAALDVIDGKDPASLAQTSLGKQTIADMMDPKQQDIERKRLESLLPSAVERDKSDFLRLVKNANDKSLAGKDKPMAIAQMDQDPVIAMALSKGGVDPKQGGMLWGDVNDVVTDRLAAMGQGQLQGVPWMHMSPQAKQASAERMTRHLEQVGAMIANNAGQAIPEAWGQAASYKFQTAMNRTIETDMAAQKSDYMGYLMTPQGTQKVYSSQAMQAFAAMDKTNMVNLQLPQNKQVWSDASHEAAKNLGVTNPSSYNATTIADIPTMKIWGEKLQTEARWDDFKGMMLGAPKNQAPNLVTQMVANNVLPPTWEALKYVNPKVLDKQGMTGQMLVAAAAGKKDIEEAYNKKVASIGPTENSIFMQGMSASDGGGDIQKWAQALTEGNPYQKGPIHNAQAAIDMVTNLAKEYYTFQGYAPNDAWRNAKNAVIGQNVEPTQHGATSKGFIWNSHAKNGYSNEPTTVNGQPVSDLDKAVIHENLGNIMSPDGLRSIGARPPVGKDGQPSPLGMMWHDQISPKTWANAVTDKNGQQGYNILYRTPLGTGSNKVDTVIPITGADGRTPIFIPRDKLVRPGAFK